MTPLSKKRRAHAKSRQGCKECKRRHVKCDEHRPICLQCSMLRRQCSYTSWVRVPAPPAQASLSPQPLAPQVESRPKTPLITTFPSMPSNLGPEHLSKPAYDLSHLALMHHIENDMMKPPHTHFVTSDKDYGTLQRLIMKCALSASYFMDELMGFAALHLSVLTDDATEKQRYSRQAVYLQDRALASFNHLAPDITEQNCTTIFLFSSFTAMHMLYDTVTAQTDLLELLGKFIQFVHLYRGLGAITNRGWHVIRESELRSILDQIEEVDRVGAASGRECDGLMSLLLASKDRLGPESYNACLAAIESLQWVFNQYNALPDPLNRHVVLAWPVHLSAEYLNLLTMRQPEAFVILAHWAVLLHWGREFWVFGNAGKFLVQAISQFLGEPWEAWMAWPVKIINTL